MIRLRFTVEDWARVRRDWSAWWAGELERPLVMIERVGPPQPGGPDHPASLAAAHAIDGGTDALLELYEAQLEATDWYGDAFPKWWPNFGPGILAGFLGASVHVAADTVWFDPPASATIEQLHPTLDTANPWWCRVRCLTGRAAARWGPAAAVGYTDLGGNLDVLASLRGTQGLLTDLVDAPGEVARASAQLTEIWLRCFDELDELIGAACPGRTPWAPLWAPGRCYMLQSDLSYMMSPRMFERYVLPDLETCCRAIDYPFYHLDGRGQLPHVGMLLALPRLLGIQWIPGDGAPPPEAWLPLLKRIRDAGKLCQLYVSASGALQIVRELGGCGFALFIEDKMEPDEATAFLDQIGKC